eukprot:1250156-Amphidinium_carterae.1
MMSTIIFRWGTGTRFLAVLLARRPAHLWNKKRCSPASCHDGQSSCHVHISAPPRPPTNTQGCIFGRLTRITTQ